MERPSESSIEVLDRLQPVLLAVFRTFRISEEKAREIVEEAGKNLASKRRRPKDPDAWLLQAVEAERTSAALVAKVGEFLRKAQHSPELRFQEPDEA